MTMQRQATAPLLSVRDLRVSYDGIPAVDGLSFDIAPGEALALVGESGCGKSTTAHAVMRLLSDKAQIGGEVLYRDTSLTQLSEAGMERIRGNRIGMIFQEPMSSLNPVYRVGEQIGEALRRHQPLPRSALRSRVIDLMKLVRLPEPERLARAFPHQLSGGQRQRVMIAIALSCKPDLLIADEPTTALDATVQAQILDLLDDLRRQLSMSLLLISHDLTVVARRTDRVIVMHHGRMMEELPAARLFGHARSAYTRGLQGASIRLEEGSHYSIRSLPEIRARQDGSGTWSFDLSASRPAPAPPVEDAAPPLLRAEGLSLEFWDRSGRRTSALKDISFMLGGAETLGLVGESGSGKTSLGRVVMQLLRPDAGRVIFDGTDLGALSERRLRPLRRDFQMIFQDPLNALNPRRTVGDMLETTLVVHGETDHRQRSLRIQDILDKVGLSRGSAGRYPHEFSGGQRQRIGIARALIIRPKLVVCDEAVSALDVSVQAQVLNLLVDLKREFGLSYLFISHDLAVVQYISDRVMVMREGRIVESGDHETIWRHPREDYTRELIAASA